MTPGGSRMGRVLAIDVGSSAVKVCVVRDGVPGRVVRRTYPTRYRDGRAEIDPDDVHAALVGAVGELAPGRVEVVTPTTLGPAFIAFDRSGTPLTPLVTHADRRSVEQARRIEREIGRARHLAVTGNRPYPGGIASTTWRWYTEHEPDRIRHAGTVGSLSTWLIHRLTGERVIDPSQASFLGVYRTTTLDGWDEDLVGAAGGRLDQLPDVRDADQRAGRLTDDSGLDLPTGTPVLTGCLDGSAAMLAAARQEKGVPDGLMVNSIGSTDVLAMAIGEPSPAPRLLTRALGIGRRWVAVATLASAGTTVDWARRTLFPDLTREQFRAAVAARPAANGVRFRPYLAGDRTALDQPRAGFAGLTLGTTRDDMLGAVLDGLARAGAARIPLLEAVGSPRHRIYVTGGAATDIDHREWPPPSGGGEWERLPLSEATLTGAALLANPPV